MNPNDRNTRIWTRAIHAETKTIEDRCVQEVGVTVEYYQSQNHQRQNQLPSQARLPLRVAVLTRLLPHPRK